MCSPHRLGKTIGWLQPVREPSVHDIMAAPGDTGLSEPLHTGSQRNDTATAAPLPWFPVCHGAAPHVRQTPRRLFYFECDFRELCFVSDAGADAEAEAACSES
jgi:hypothetical protein